MHDNEQPRSDLLAELQLLRARVATLEQQQADHMQTEQMLRQRQDELESLLDTSRDLTGTLTAEQLLPLIAERVTELLESDECVLFERQPDGQTMRAILALGVHADAIRGTVLSVDQGLSGIVIRTGEPLIVNDAHDDPRNVQIPRPKSGDTVRAHALIVPLAIRGRTIGAMVLNRVPGRPFTEDDRWLLTGFAQHVAVAIENARLYEQVQQHAGELEQRVELRTAELQTQKERVEAIVNSVADGLLITDQDGLIIDVNPALLRMTGDDRDTLIGMNVYDLNTSQQLLSPELIASIRQDARTSGYIRLEMPIQRPDGSMFDGDLNVSPLRDPDDIVRGFVIALRDVTALKEVQRMKDDFVSNVTHELRTPITSLKLRHHLIRATPEKLTEHLAVLERETNRLSRIIDDLLTLSRIDQERTQFDLAPLDLNPLAEEYTFDRQPVAEAARLRLVLGERARSLPLVRADRGLLGQAVSVILTNAINYTPPGGEVRIGTAATARKGQQWAGIYVSDTGPGIPQDECAELFTRFFRGSAARASKVSGTGLGLAIADAIVKQHSGDIAVESAGVGATFTIWLPAAS